ncbi:MAG: Na+-dependent transporter [Candidatus Methanomethylophilus sp.]|nr:Na+-dependent transporter [Methanomethylophilus sp.]
MDFWNYATDVRLYVLAGIVVALCVGSLGEIVASLSIVVLIMQMTASIHGLHLKKGDFRKELRPAFISLLCCFGISTATALLMGLLFKSTYIGMWYGWVMLAAVPSAVSVITLGLMMKGNMAMALISMVLIYALALLLTPAMTIVLIGDAVSPLEILKYIILFIAIPVAANYLLGRYPVQRKYKITFINAMMFLLLVFALGKNREFIFSDGLIIVYIILACIFRTFVVGAVVLWYGRKGGYERDNVVIYTGYAVWKNSGLATAMCMLLLPGIPEAALPCTISLVIESVWFAVTNKEVATHWPADIYH